MYYMWTLGWVVVAIVQFFLLSTSVNGGSKRKAIFFVMLSVCMLVVTYKYGLSIANFYGDLIEAEPADWHCVENPDSPQCNGGMLIAHLLFLILSGWNLVFAPLLILFFSVKGLIIRKVDYQTSC